MTNKEKAIKISGYDITREGWNYPEPDKNRDVYRACLEMAQWKNEQFEYFLIEKKKKVMCLNDGIGPIYPDAYLYIEEMIEDFKKMFK